MKIFMPLLLISCTFLFSCSNENPLIESTLEAQDQNLKINETHKNSSQKGVNNRPPLKVFRSAGSIEIDGQETEWSEVPKHKMRVEIDLGFELDNKFDLSSYFKMLWDDNHLYVFAKILDEEINTAADQLFEKDGFEIYIDGNNSKTEADYNTPSFPPAAYGNNTDFFRYIPGETQALAAWGIIDASTFESVIYFTEDGYNVETKIPFSSFPDFPADAGHLFGLEFQTNDNDNDQRQQLVKWWSDNDFSYLDPSMFGTAVLFKATAE